MTIARCAGATLSSPVLRGGGLHDALRDPGALVAGLTGVEAGENKAKQRPDEGRTFDCDFED